MSWLSSLIRNNRWTLDLLSAAGKEWLRAQIDSIDAMTVEDFKKQLKERIDKL